MINRLTGPEANTVAIRLGSPHSTASIPRQQRGVAEGAAPHKKKGIAASYPLIQNRMVQP